MLFNPRPRGLGKENFLKLNDGEEVTGVFKGQIYTYKRHWVNQRGIECSGEGCPICKADVERKNYPGFRFRINFVTSKDDKWIARIFEGGGEIYDTLAMLDKKYDLSKTPVEITRRGTGTNTKYHIMPRTDYPITKEIEVKIKAVPLHALNAQVEE